MTVGTAEAMGLSEVMILGANDILSILHSNPVLKSISHDYASVFHSQLTKSVAPNSKWPDDVQVTAADHAEMVLSMTRDKRILISLLALAVLRNSRHWTSAIARKNIRLLEHEVQLGESVLVENAKGKVERIVAVVAVHLTRGKLMLAQIAELVDGVLEASVKLVGGKRAEVEPPREAVERILSEKMSAAYDAVCLEGSDHTTEHGESDRFCVPTTYSRTVFFGTFDESFVWPSLQGVHQVSNDHAHAWRHGGVQHQMPDVDQCFILCSGGRQHLYGWVDPDTFEFFKTPAGLKALQERWLPSLRT